MGSGEPLGAQLGGHRDHEGPAKSEGCWVSPANAGDARPRGSHLCRLHMGGKQG